MLKTALFAGLLLLSCQSASAVTLKIATLAPDGTLWMKQMKAAGKTIAKDTEGRVNFKFYPGGVMGSDATVMKKMRLRQLHGGAVTAGALATHYPAIDLFSLPFAFNKQEEVTALRALVGEDLKTGLREKGFELIGLTETGFAYLMSRHPIRTVSDLKKRKAWVPEGDKLAEAIYSAASINPVPLALADVYTGLQTGIIDTVSVPPVGAIALQWANNMRYAVDLPLVYVMGALVVDAKAYKKVSPADQIIVENAFNVAFEALNKRNQQDNIQARSALEKMGVEFIRMGPEEEAHWRNLGQQVRHDFIQTLDPSLASKLGR